MKRVTKHTERFYVAGQFRGKYYGYLDEAQSTAHREDYLIQLYEGRLLQARPGTEGEFEAMGKEGAGYRLQDLEEVAIEPATDNGESPIIYRTAFKGIRISQVKLSLVQKQGRQTFGTITGNAVALVERVVYREVWEPEPPTVIQIDKPDVWPKTESVSNLNSETGLDEVQEYTNDPISIREVVKDFFQLLPLILALGSLLFFIGLALSLLSPEGWLAIGVLLSIGLLLWIFRGLSLLLARLLSYVFQSLAGLFILSLLALFLFSQFLSMPRLETVPRVTPPLAPDEQRVAPDEDAAPAQAADYVEHRLAWSDYEQNPYAGTIRVYTHDFLYARQQREQSGISPYDPNWPARLLPRIAADEKERLGFLYQMIDSIQNETNLDRRRFAALTVSLVQDIPYAMLLPWPCPTAPTPCVSPVAYGLHSPVEFLYTLQGDCDTRALLLYVVLARYGYDVILLGSQRYQHALIGINLPWRGDFFPFRGKRYYIWETTAPGWLPGQMPPECRDLSHWGVLLAPQ